jgi:EAL domain-containing protein (putative c-di-GMP-specific phosphodiesterase class I)
MHRAKLAGKSRCQVFDAAMHAQAVKRLEIEAEIRRGIRDNEFKVYYQPIVSLKDGRIVGVEALSRWQKVDRLLLPGEFIEIADETGLIIPINRQLLLESCQRLKRWQSECNIQPPLFLSVNIPPRQFVDPNLIDAIASVLEQTEMDRSALELEIVETVVMDEPDASGKILADLKALDVRLCIDDFGIGYSSLSRLQSLPVHALKIDRSFIQQIEVDKTKQDVVRTIVQLAHALGLRVVAEGIETRAQAVLVRELGCELAQGFYFSRPESADCISPLIAKGHLDFDSDSVAANA